MVTSYNSEPVEPTGAFTVIPDEDPTENVEETHVQEKPKTKSSKGKKAQNVESEQEPAKEPELDPHLRSWANAALQQGVAKTDIDRALEYIKSNPEVKIRHQSDFYNVIEEILADDTKVQEQNQRILQATVSRDITNFGDINRALHNKIREVYNTSAVSSIALGDFLNRHLQKSDLDDANGNACYWAYYHIKSDLVRSGISDIFQKWDKSKNVHQFISDFAAQSDSFSHCESFKDICECMTSLLPEHYAREDSPLKYKAWKYVIIQMNGGRDLSNEDTALFNTIFNDVHTMTEYCAHLQNALESGEPIEQAEAMATAAALQADTTIPLASTIGRMGGKIAALRYSWSDSFERGMIEGAGVHAQAMLEHQNEINARREQLRFAREQAQMNAQMQMNAQAPTQPNYMNGYPQQPMYNQPYMDPYNQPQVDPYGNPYQDPRRRRSINQRRRMQQHLDQYGRPIPQQEYDEYGRPIQRMDPRYRRNRRRQQDMYNDPYGRQGYDGYADDDYDMPSVPLSSKMVIVVIHIIIAVLFILFKKPLGIIGTLGIGVATFGWIKTTFDGNTPLFTNPETGENSIIIFAIGYILALLALILH